MKKQNKNKIMKRILLFALIAITSGLSAQGDYSNFWSYKTYADINRIKSSSIPHKLFLDNDKNTTIIGSVSSTVDFNLLTGGVDVFNSTSPSMDNSSIFITKIDTCGNYLFTRIIEGVVQGTHNYSPNPNIRLLDVTLGNNDDILIYAMLLGSIKAETINNDTIYISSAHDDHRTDMMVLCLNNDGLYKWSRRLIHSSTDESSKGITVDKDDNIIVGGSQGLSIPFIYSPVDTIFQSADANYVLHDRSFLWSMKSNGEINYLKGLNNGTFFDLKTNENNELIAGVNYTTSITLDTDFTNLPNPTNSGLFTSAPATWGTALAKYDELGNYITGISIGARISKDTRIILDSTTNDVFLYGKIGNSPLNIIDGISYILDDEVIIKFDEDLNYISHTKLDYNVDTPLQFYNDTLYYFSSSNARMIKVTKDLNVIYTNEVYDYPNDTLINTVNVKNFYISDDDLILNYVNEYGSENVNHYIDSYKKTSLFQKTENLLICNSLLLEVDLSMYDSVYLNNSILPDVFYFSQEGEYMLEGYINNCKTELHYIIDTSSASVDVIIDEYCFGGNVPISINTSSSVNQLSFSGPNDFSSSSLNPILYNISSNSIGTYQLNIEFNNGCHFDSIIQLESPFESCFEIPAIITPNNDGLNDYWIIDFLNLYPNHELSIYNRWGTKVYSASPYENEFNGYANRGLLKDNNPLPNGTYFYVIELEDDKNEVMKGHLEIQK